MAEDQGTTETPQFSIFRAKDAPSLQEANCMVNEPFTDVQRAGMDKAIEAGFLEGAEVHVLAEVPGFSVTHVWFKAGYTLPLHSHNVDCLYYIVAGSLRMGTEELGPRDSFFLPASMPYTYTPGPDGVELLEIRQQGHFNFVNLAKGAAFWEKAAQISAARRDNWNAAKLPQLN